MAQTPAEGIALQDINPQVNEGSATPLQNPDENPAGEEKPEEAPMNFTNLFGGAGLTPGEKGDDEEDGVNIGRNLFAGVMFKNLNDYNPFLAPPKIELAQLYGKTQRAGNILQLFKLEHPNTKKLLKNYDEVKNAYQRKDPCSGDSENGISVSLFISTSLLTRLGTAIPSFFSFSKFCAIILTVYFVIHGIYFSYDSIDKNRCNYGGELKNCGPSWKFGISAAFTDSETKGHFRLNHALFYISLLIIYLLRVFFFRKARQSEAKADEITTDITDYSVEIRGLPHTTTKKDIADFFSRQDLKHENGNPIPIKTRVINLAFSDLGTLHSKERALKRIIGKYIRLPSSKTAELEALEKEFEKLATEAKELMEREYRQDEQNPKHLEKFTGNAYVSFETQMMAEVVERDLAIKSLAYNAYKLLGSLRGPAWLLPGARSYQLYENDEKDNEGYFYIEGTEKPQEVIFENLGLSAGWKFIRKIISFLISAILILGTFALVIWLKYELETYKPDTAFKKFLVGILVTVLVNILNVVVKTATPILVNFTRPETKTVRNEKMIWRLAFAIFLNSIVVLIVANYVVDKDKLRENFFSELGLGNDLYMMVVLQIIVPFVSFLDAGLIIKLLKRYLIAKHGDKETKMQYEINPIYEGAIFVFPVRVGKYCTCLLLTFFTIYIFPTTALWSLLCIFLFYWSDKIFLLRMATLPEFCTSRLIISLFRFVDFGLFAAALSVVIYDLIYFKKNTVEVWFFFGLFLFNFLFNLQALWKKIFSFSSDEAATATMTLHELLPTIRDETYGAHNPVNKFWVALKLYTSPGFLKHCKTADDVEDFDISEDHYSLTQKQNPNEIGVGNINLGLFGGPQEPESKQQAKPASKPHSKPCSKAQSRKNNDMPFQMNIDLINEEDELGTNEEPVCEKMKKMPKHHFAFGK